MDEQIQRGKEWLEKLLFLMNIPTEVKVGRIEDKPNASCWLTIDESKLSSYQIEQLIGKKGETIDSLEYLANVLLNMELEDELKRLFIVELHGYRIRRQAELVAIAQKAANKVRLTGLQEEITGLSSVERRQIHTLLEQFEELTTESKGQEPYRRLLVNLRR